MRPDLFSVLLKKKDTKQETIFMVCIVIYAEDWKRGGGKWDSNSISTNLPPWLQMRSPLCSRQLLLEG